MHSFLQATFAIFVTVIGVFCINRALARDSMGYLLVGMFFLLLVLSL